MAETRKSFFLFLREKIDVRGIIKEGVFLAVFTIQYKGLAKKGLICSLILFTLYLLY